MELSEMACHYWSRKSGQCSGVRCTCSASDRASLCGGHGVGNETIDKPRDEYASVPRTPPPPLVKGLQPACRLLACSAPDASSSASSKQQRNKLLLQCSEYLKI